MEGKSCFEEIVLVNDCSRTDCFLRQFAHADLSKFDAALEQIQAERLVDRVVHFDGNPELAKRVNERWFGVSDHVGTHSEEGAQYASTFYAFDEIRSDIILQCDSDIIFRVSDGHDMDLVQECAEFMEEEEECLTVGVPIVMRNPVPLGYRHVGMRKERNQVRTFPVEVRCSFIHRDRLLHLLPLKIPDHARGAGDFLINKNL